ncbi:glutamate ABC transporter substrate-binding protein [Streptomyces gamaensis]|uniref:Glutamate ABC transporter substrate-binding protein n=1 Tax=Streptomyces gamaensis TaxID=1763542 RepID=A0ABW0YVP3_9ACTN
MGVIGKGTRARAGRRRATAAVALAAGCALTATAWTLRPAPAGEGHAGRGAPAAARTAARPAAPADTDATDTAGAGRPAAARGTCRDGEADASLRPSAADGPAVQQIKKRGHLVAGIDQNSYRWGYRDPESGEPVGFDIDLVRAIAKDILGDGGKVVFLAIPTSRRIPAVQQHQVDVVVRTMTINCERAGKVAFSTAYFEAGQQLLAPKDSAVTAFDDSLRGKRICAAKGSTAETELKKNDHGASVLTVPNQLDCLVRVQLGQADAVLTDSALAAGQAAQDPSVKLFGKPFTKELYGVAMNQEDTDLVRRVNKVLEDYRGGGAAGPWMQAYRKWLAADLPGITAPPAPKYLD